MLYCSTHAQRTPVCGWVLMFMFMFILCGAHQAHFGALIQNHYNFAHLDCLYLLLWLCVAVLQTLGLLRSQGDQQS